MRYLSRKGVGGSTFRKTVVAGRLMTGQIPGLHSG